MRIEDHLRNTARSLPAKTALVAGGRRLSYRDLDDESDRLANALIARGLRHGDRVVLLLDNIAEAVVSLYAVCKAGAVACPLPPLTKVERLTGICERLQPAAVVAQSRLTAIADRACPAEMLRIAIPVEGQPIDAGWLPYADLLSAAPTQPPDARGEPDDLALIIHTSGSTGVPKGVMLSHANVLAACTSIVGYLENTADDVILSVLPLSFGYGLTQVVTAAISGATLVLEKSFAFPRVILARMAEEGVTGFPLVPMIAALILQMKDLQPGFLPHLRYITSAAAQLPPALSSGLRHLLPQTRLYIMYGQTECIRATWLPAGEVADRPTSTGIAIPGSEVLVVDEDGNPTLPGVTGELIVRGPHVMQGYWRDDAATAATVRAAPAPWGRELRTGDLFRVDAEGYFYFVGRRDDMIKTRGEKVSPQEVERVLYTLDGVREAAVTGVADPVLGEAIKAVIALEEGIRIDAREVIRHCTRHLEDFMVPKWVEFRDSLPKTVSGKIRLEKQNELGGETV